MANNTSKKSLSQNTVAGLYIVMGIMLVTLDFMWSLRSELSVVTYVVACIIGILPVVARMKFDIEESDDTEDYWNDAKEYTTKFVIFIVLFAWINVSIYQVIGDDLSHSVYYMIPAFAGIGYLMLGTRFLLNRFVDDEW